MLTKALDACRFTFLWLSNAPNRQRIRGARVQAVCLLLARKPVPSIALVHSVYGDWMPPQEGVLLRESIEDAGLRCIEEELGVDMPRERLKRLLTIRSKSVRLGTLRMPPHRVGEREVADDVGDGPLSRVRMTQKTYYAVVAVAADTADILLVPNGREVDDLTWCTLDRALELISDTARPEKALLLAKGLDVATLHLYGRHAEPKFVTRIALAP